jgi:signal transduction histidine kinase
MTWSMPLGAERADFSRASRPVDERSLLTAVKLAGPRLRLLRGMVRRLRLEHALEVSADAHQTLVAAPALARENLELKAALGESRRELVDARARIIRASDRARGKLERDLHDGAQQRLTAILIKLRVAQEFALDEDLTRRLESISVDAELAVDELRALARGIYPAALRDRGLAAAVRSLAIGAPIPVGVIDEGIGRCSALVEAAVYFCVSEAVQNTIKHAGADVRVTVDLRRGPRRGIRFEVTDDGVGMKMPSRSNGIGLISMRDRIGAVSGELEISSAPGRGTSVRGTVPDDRRPQSDETSDCLADRRIVTPDRDLTDRVSVERSAEFA